MSVTIGMKWYEKVLTVLLIVLIPPLIILGLLLAVPSLTREYRRSKKEYYKSPYYATFKKKFAWGITNDPVYRVYNGAAARDLPVRFPDNMDDRIDGLSYFFYGDTVYLLPNFEQMGLSEDGRAVWQVNNDGDWMDFDEGYAATRVQAMYPDLTVKFLVERCMITVCDLTETPPPSCVFVTGSYDTAFENEDSPLKMMVPQNAEELYAMMQKTPDLCGEYELTENRDGIRWRVREDVQITLGVDPRDGYIGVDRLLNGKLPIGITHWHPTVYEIYDEVCEIGRRGHVLVLSTRAGSGAVLYSGKKEDCPYKPDKKDLLGKYY